MKAWKVRKPGTLQDMEVNYETIKFYRNYYLEKGKNNQADAYKEIIIRLDSLRSKGVELTPDVIENTVNQLLSDMKKDYKILKKKRRNRGLSDLQKEALNEKIQHVKNVHLYAKHFSLKETQEDASTSALLISSCV